MTSFTRLAGTTALCSFVIAPAAMADVTADDVWQVMQDQLAAIGPVKATQARSGDTLSVSGINMTFQLPFDTGTIALNMAGFDLTENGDGTVALSYHEPYTYGVVVDVPNEGTFSGTIEFTFDNASSTISGDPGDIVYDYAIGQLDMRVTQLDFPESDKIDISMEGSITDMSGSSRITVGDLITNQGTHNVGRQTITVAMTDPEGGTFNYTSDIDQTTSTASVALPRGGMEILNLAAALTDGLDLQISATSTGYKTTQINQKDGQTVSEQSSTADTYYSGVALNSTGLHVDGQATDITSDMNTPEIFPLPISIAAASAGGNMTLPLSASDELQDFALAMKMDGLTVNEDLLSMVDPSQALPRDPMTLDLDLSGKVKNLVNWLNIYEVMALEDSGKVPAELHALTLNNLVLDAAGALLTGVGGATFDNSDLETFGGMPRPTGAVDLTLKGGNGLLDTLVTMGLLSEEDVQGARMMSAMFASPDPEGGEDALKSRLEINEEGQVFANGQRLR